MTTYIISVSEAEDLALSHIAYSSETWVNDFVHERARVAMDDIVSIAVQKCLQENIQIPGTKEEIVSLAFSKKWIETAKERTDNSEQNRV